MHICLRCIYYRIYTTVYVCMSQTRSSAALRFARILERIARGARATTLIVICVAYTLAGSHILTYEHACMPSARAARKTLFLYTILEHSEVVVVETVDVAYIVYYTIHV